MRVTWLHVSDLHAKAGESYDRNVVLRSLIRSVSDYRQQGLVPDVIFATGDIAHSGKAPEYDEAGKFFQGLLTATQLDKKRLFVIPGNHDVDRELGVGLARTLGSREDSSAYFQPQFPKPHLTQKLRAFRDWHNKFFDGIRDLPDERNCIQPQLLEVNGRRFGILSLNSALFCLGDDDHGKLWIGRRCLDAGVKALREINAEINIALVHHPLEWLHPEEFANIQSVLEGSIQILLRGHLHETRVETVSAGEGAILHCAAGATYQSRRYSNRALYGTVDGGQLTVYPIRYEDSPIEIWTTDSSVFPRDYNNKHQKTFQIPPNDKLVQPQELLKRDTPSADTTPLKRLSNIGSRGDLPFVGRDGLIATIGSILTDPRTEKVVVIHGPPGVGKSELAREFARLNRDRYSRGTFLVDASADAVAINLANIGKNILNLPFRADLPLNDQGQQTFQALGDGPVLLIYDNVPSLDSISAWLPFAGMPCHVLITTFSDGSDLTWPCVEVRPLSQLESLELANKLTKGQLPKHFAEAIAEHAGGLPVQIIWDASTLAYERKRGRITMAHLGLAKVAGDSFRSAYERLEPPARLFLHAAAIFNPQHIPAAELSRHLNDVLGWRESDVQRTVDTCCDLHLLNGSPDLSMHQLFASFIRETVPSAYDKRQLAQITPIQKKRFAQLAENLSENPANIQNAAIFLAYPLTPDRWADLEQVFSDAENDAVGGALSAIGHFDEARPWLEQSVKEKELRIAKGSIAHEILGRSLHEVGYCLASTGKYDEACSWFQLAVSEKQQGDLQGLVDHESLGRSLHQVGFCMPDDARSWFERAVAEKEQGDVLGRVDHSSVGLSWHQVGASLLGSGRFEEAYDAFQRAVEEARKGDVEGRIDHDSLGISLHQVGACLLGKSQYDKARNWYELAVAELQKGDKHGRVDHISLGLSLHQVGDCLCRMGLFSDAEAWLQRAVAEEQQGDVNGRINHDSLGRSLHQLGFCMSSLHLQQEAKSLFERAIAEKERGDLHGRVDHTSLGLTLHRMGVCLTSLGLKDQAGIWFQRAVDEKRKGGFNGRIDHATLGLSLEHLGLWLSSASRDNEAAQRLEEAIAEKEKGDIYGHVNISDVRVAISAAAACFRRLGQDQRAVELEEHASSLQLTSEAAGA